MSRKLKRRVRAKRRTKSAAGSGVKEQNARAQPHPLIGALRGTVTVAPGTDLTQPADPEWGKLAYGDGCDHQE
jgi:hypothetical protein